MDLYANIQNCWRGGGGLIVCISAASSLVSIILKSIFLLQNKDNNIFTIFFSATTDHLAEGRD